MPHSCRQVPATRQLSTGQLDILGHETTKYTPNDLLLLFIKDLLVMGNQYFWWASKILDHGCPGSFCILNLKILTFTFRTSSVNLWHLGVYLSESILRCQKHFRGGHIPQSFGFFCLFWAPLQLV
jgi:hypothetical protein